MPDAPDVGFQFGVEGDQSLLSTIRALREELKKVKLEQNDVASSARSLSGAWQSLVALGLGYKLLELTKEAFNSAVSIGRLSAATGISTQTLSTFRKATEDAGLSQQDADNSIKRLARSMVALQQGNKQAAMTFAMLRDEAGKPLTAQSFRGLTDDQKFLKVVDALGRVKGSMAATGAIEQLLGRSSGELLAVMQRLSGEGFAEVRRQTEALGLLVTPQMVAAMMRAKGSMQDLKDVAVGAATQFETGFVPAVADAADALVAGISMKGGNAFEYLGEVAGKALKWIIDHLARIAYDASASAIQIEEIFGWAWDEVKNGASVVFGAFAKAAKGDFSGAWSTLKAGARDAVSDYQDTVARIQAIRENERQQNQKVHDALYNNKSKREPHRTQQEINAALAAQAQEASAKLSLKVAEAAAAKAAGQEELQNYRALARQRAQADKQAYDDGLITLTEYFNRRRAAIEKERTEEIKILTGEKAGLQGLIGSAQKLPALTPQDEITKQRQILEIRKQIHAIDSQISLLDTNTNTQLQANEHARHKAEDDHEIKRLDLLKQIAEAEGRTSEAARLAGQIQDLQVRGQLQQIGMSKAAIDATLGELGTARGVRTTAGTAQKGFDAGSAALESHKAALQDQVAEGQLTPYQAEAQLRAAYAAEIPLLEQKVQLLREQAEAAKGTDLGTDLNKQADQDEAKILHLRAEMAGMHSGIISGINQVSQHVTTGLNGWIQGHQRFGQAVAQTWAQIVMTSVTSMEKIAQQWIAHQLRMLLIKRTTDQQQATSEAQAKAQQDALDKKHSLSSVFASAKAAAAKAYEAFAWFPPLGAAAAAATFAAVMAFGAFAQGGYVDAGRAAPRIIGFAAGGHTARSLLGGGSVRGPGTATSDSIPAMLSHGEYVVNARAVNRIGPETLDMMNRGAFLPPVTQIAPYTAAGLHRYASGGAVEPASGAAGQGHTFSFPTTIGNVSALDGASVRAALEQHGDLVGRIAVAAVKRHYRTGGVL